ncbi:hypothetical protein ABPG74_018430 [Tetrahymena malaccensis]
MINKQFSFLILCLLGLTCAFLTEPSFRKRSLKEKYIDNLLNAEGKKSLDFSTQCNNLNLASHFNGTAMSGYLNVGIKNSSSALGFVFFGAKGVPTSQLKNIPTIIWIEGGPGCTSMYGAFIENGPLHVIQESNTTFSFKENSFAWTNDYNVIYIDQPIGTGISHAQKKSDIPIDEDQIAQQFYFALNQLYHSENGCFKQIGINGKETPLFIYGISYAGKYVPSIAQYIVQQGNKLNLKGIGMGDGFTSPYYDVESVNKYSYDHNLITLDQFNKNQIKVQQVQKLVNQTKWLKAKDQFEQLMDDVNPNNLDIYNIQRKEAPDATYLESFVNSKYGQETFSFKLDKTFEICGDLVFEVLSTDYMKEDCVARVEYLLHQEIYVHIYNGNLDLLVPYYTPQLWLSKLNWEKTQQFNKTPLENWSYGNNGTIYGQKQQYDLLNFQIIFNAGHMVTEDQPEAGYHLIKDQINYVLSKQQF